MTRRALVLVAAAHGLATLLHFLHNAFFLPSYPGLPLTWTSMGVALAWLPVGATGAFGVDQLLRGNTRAGRTLLGAFGILGFAGFLHYAMAPFSSHSLGMHAAIFAEAATGALLLLALARRR